MLRSLAGLAKNKEGLYLVARRLPGGALGGLWEFPGGKAEENESDAEALLREFQEEFSISIEVGPLLAKSTFKHKNKDYSLRAYAVNLLSERFSLNEHSEIAWKSLEEIEKLSFADSDRSLLGQLKEKEAKGL